MKHKKDLYDIEVEDVHQYFSNGIVSHNSSAGIDTLLYTIFNTTSKNNRKNLNIINQNRERGRGKVVIDIDGNEYTIERTSEKYTKKSKGVEITEAKTDVEFTGIDESTLTGLDRSDTDKIIRKYLGTVDDFMLTSAATQFSAQSFISEGSTNRKAILAKFLDLDLFEAKFKAAKSEVAATKVLLKKLETIDYEKEINETKELIKLSEKNIESANQELLVVSDELNKNRQELFSVQSQIKILEKDNTKLTDLLKNKDGYSQAIKILNDRIIQCESEINKLTMELSGLQPDLSVNIEELLSNKSKIDANSKTLDELRGEHALVKQQNNTLKERIKLLSEVPCGTQFPNCKFINNAHTANDKKPQSDKKLIKINAGIDKLLKEQAELDAESVSKKIDRYNTALSVQQKINNSIKEIEASIEKWKYKLEIGEESLEKTIKELVEFNNSDSDKDVYDTLVKSEREIKLAINSLEMNYSGIQQKVTNLYKESGYLVSKLETLEEQKQELAEKRAEFGVYDLFLKCMHPNGISYQVIKNKLPVINEEINKILANVVEFEVYLLNDDDKLDIMIKHPKHEARPLEMGSGAEKSLASIAIRLAFLQVTSLPKSDFIILDEPGTSLDPDNLSGFIRILDLIKSYFKTVILISHLDVLKDAVDVQITIDRRGDYAYVNQ